jgi:hypothetical protein
LRVPCMCHPRLRLLWLLQVFQVVCGILDAKRDSYDRDYLPSDVRYAVCPLPHPSPRLETVRDCWEGAVRPTRPRACLTLRGASLCPCARLQLQRAGLARAHLPWCVRARVLCCVAARSARTRPTTR